MSKENRPTRPNSFGYNAFKVLLGSSSATLVSFICAPIIVRLFEPEAYGAAAIFAAIVGIVSPLLMLRYEQAIVPAGGKAERENVFSLSFLLLLVNSLIVAGLLYALNSSSISQTELKHILEYAWALPFGIFIAGAFIILNVWMVSHDRFSIIGLVSLISGLTTTIASMVLGVFGHTSGGSLIFSAIFGQLLGVGAFVFVVFSRDIQSVWRTATKRRIMDVAINFKHFPFYSIWSIMLGNGSFLLPTILMGAFFSIEFVGLFALAFRLLQMPAALIGSALSQVFFKTLDDRRRENRASDFVEKLVSNLFIMSLYPFVGISLMGGDFFGFAFGENWAQAGYFAQIMSMWAWLTFVSGSLSATFSVYQKQSLQLSFQILNFVTKILCFAIAVYLDSGLVLIVLFGVTGFFVYGFKLYLTLSVVEAKVVRIAQQSWRSIIAVLFFAAILATLVELGLHVLWQLLYAAITYALLVGANIYFGNLTTDIATQS